jgi:hypothetical protein
MAAQHPSAAGALDFLNLVGLLKKLKRTGWVREGVHLPESVAGKQRGAYDCNIFNFQFKIIHVHFSRGVCAMLTLHKQIINIAWAS